MGFEGQARILLAIVIYILFLFINRVGLEGYNNENKIGVILRIYLLTIGLAISPVINGIFILIYICFYFLNTRKVSRRDFSIIVLCVITCIYIILNTLLIFAKKDFDPEFNPYIGMFEYIIYFIYYILLRTEKYSDTENNLLVSHTCLFSIAVFWITILDYLTMPLSRMSGIFRNSNLLGIYSAVIFALVFFNNTLKLSGWLKRLVLISASLMLILSFSRVAWLGVIVYLVLFFFFGKLAFKRKILVISVLFISGILIMSNDAISEMINIRVFSAFDIEDYSTSDRVVLIQAAWDSFKESPIWGNGIRSFASIVKSGLYSIWGANVLHPHNAYFETLQSLGIMGFALFSAIIYKSVKGKNKNIGINRTLIMFLIIGMLNRLFNEFSTTVWFWLILSFY